MFFELISKSRIFVAVVFLTEVLLSSFYLPQFYLIFFQLAVSTIVNDSVALVLKLVKQLCFEQRCPVSNTSSLPLIESKLEETLGEN